MHDRLEHPDERPTDRLAARPDEAADSARIESLLAIWAEANAASPGLADRIFEASRGSIAARRAARPTLGDRLGELLSLFSPPRLALAALLVACMALVLPTCFSVVGKNGCVTQEANMTFTSIVSQHDWEEACFKGAEDATVSVSR